MTTDSDLTPRLAQQGADIFIRALKKHWLLGTVVVLSVLAGSIFHTIGQKRIYSASATVLINPNPARPLGKDVQTVVEMGAGTYWTNKEYYGTQLEILRGRTIARETVRTLSLHKDNAFLENAAPSAVVSARKREATIEDATSALLGRVKVDPVKDSRLMVARVEDADPERGRRILSTMLDVYLERNVSQMVESSVAASEWLRNQTDKLKLELEQSELALHNYKKDKRILSVSLDDQSNMLRGEMQQLSEFLTRVGAHREELASRVHELDRVNPDDVMTLPAKELLSSSILTTLRQDYIQAKGEMESLLGAGKGENYPAVDAVRARVETTRQALMAEVNNVHEALQGDLASTTNEAKGISRLFEQAKQRALDLNMLEIEYRRLERTKDNNEKLFGLVLERSKESDLTGMLRFNNITVAEQPLAGSAPVRPRVPLNLALGLIFGLALGVAAAVGREWLDRTIRSPEDIEEVVGVPLLGLLPSLSGKAPSSGYYASYSRRHRSRSAAMSAADTAVELIVHALPSSNAAECARAIRTSLTFAAPDKPLRTILVTSGNPSEGKTMVASTIAVAFAQTGQRVLLVDCDLRRARLHRIFKLTNASGVTSVLQNPSSLDSTIATTEVPNLSLLGSGPHVPNPAEVLQSESFERLLKTLAEKFDRVIIDSPPVIVVTDAAVLAARVDATVVVMRARKTRRDLARQVVRKMVGLGAKVAGVVLNAMEEPKRKGGYYYGYYYSRDRYGTGGETDSAA